MGDRIVVPLINGVMSIIQALLALRIVLKLFGASTQAPFVRWIYETTEPLLAPFNGMFPTAPVSGGFVLEISSLFALITYVFVGYVLTEVIGLLVYHSGKRHK